ncbi:hypothetical protein PIB30_040636 [Stylosanthes scabra]|uniref:Ubiquitin-like protease family profile domain-containing protein n=1 Tax=Stylosanthes scabra TaxID=79078 RepID=A0ABU6VG52_9FABA|nr:hypothetical protein [Stylosanthes scabra]
MESNCFGANSQLVFTMTNAEVILVPTKFLQGLADQIAVLTNKVEELLSKPTNSIPSKNQCADTSLLSGPPSISKKNSSTKNSTSKKTTPSSQNGETDTGFARKRKKSPWTKIAKNRGHKSPSKNDTQRNLFSHEEDAFGHLSAELPSVLILVSTMLTHNDDGRKWFLSPIFAQIILHFEDVTMGTWNYLKTHFMNSADNLEKIYVPIHMGFHWFLMIVNLPNKEVVYLDSKKLQKELRMNAIHQVLLSDGTYKLPVGISPTISTYKIVDPEVTQQEDDSNDCGIYVAQWMILSDIWRTFDVAGVNDYTRMRLAIDLVTEDHNIKKKEIEDLAMKNWNDNLVPI